ncbi:hypothetical protein BC828DRAFT_188546 [Blastocladiella britannica]|nr:hypothetical protein BC828DRAFT_188546 [Blastocladiella britannica]
MHTPIFLLLVALVCLAAASPVSLTDTASVAVKSSSGGSSSITCRNNKEPRFIPVYRSDWPGRFDVGNGFWARDQYACAVASLNAGFAGSVYRFDTSMCYMKFVIFFFQSSQ